MQGPAGRARKENEASVFARMATVIEKPRLSLNTTVKVIEITTKMLRLYRHIGLFHAHHTLAKGLEVV